MSNSSFVNEYNFPLPSEEEMKQKVERARTMFKDHRELKDKLAALHSQIQAVDSHIAITCSEIRVFDVRIESIDEIHPFTSLSEAEQFKKALCDAGIKQEHVTIHLTMEFGSIHMIDGHKTPEMYSHLFDVAIKAKVYKEAQEKAQKKSNDSLWLN